MASTRTPRNAPVEESLVVAVLDLANHLSRRGDALAARSGLTTQQWLVLLHVAGDPGFFPRGVPSGVRANGVLPSEIAKLRGVSRANVSALVAALRRRRLIRQIPDPGDRRRTRLTITAAGLRALASIEPERRRANRRLLAGLTGDERRRMLAYLESCLQALQPGRPRTTTHCGSRAEAT